MALFDSESDLRDPEGKIRTRAYGIIQVENGSFIRIRFRPWPKIISRLEISLFGNRNHEGRNSKQRVPRDRCLLFYNQPFFHRRFLALKYVVSDFGTSFQSFRLATRVLDEVARIKRSDAILCEVTNPCISNRLMHRWGWERHLKDQPTRHFIKRFYGKYPDSLLTDSADPAIAETAASDDRNLVAAG